MIALNNLHCIKLTLKLIMLLIMTFSIFVLNTVSEASTRSFQIKCNRINIKHKDNLIVFYISQNFSIEKMNDFIIKGEQAIISVDKTNLKPEVTLPDDFSGLKTQINKQQKTVALDNIKSIEIQGNIQFIAKKDKIKLTASRINSTDGAVTFYIDNPKLVKASSTAQDINVKANATILNTKTNTITLNGNCAINVLDPTKKAKLFGTKVVYKYKNGSITASGSSGTISSNGYDIDFKANSIIYSINTSNSELIGLNYFLIKNNSITAKLSAKHIIYSPNSIKARFVKNLEVNTATKDIINAYSDEIIYSPKTEIFSLGTKSEINWKNTDKPSLKLKTSFVEVNLKTQFITFKQRSSFTFDKDYFVEANAGFYNRKTGSGNFRGSVVVKNKLQSSVNCDAIEFTINNELKRIELKNLKESKIIIKE